MRRLFTGFDETNLLILESLDLKSLLCMSLTNHYFYTWCNSNKLWISRIQTDYDKNVLRYKPTKFTFKQQYFSFSKYNIEEATILGRLDIVYWHRKNGNFPSMSSIFEAIREGHVNVLKYLNKSLEPREINLAIEYGHLRILEWALTKGYVAQSDNISLAIKHNQLHIVRWLLSLKVVPDHKSADFAIKRDHKGVLLHLIKRNPPVFPSSKGANIALIRGYNGMLRFLIKNNVFPTSIGADEVAKAGFLDRLQYLSELVPPVLPTNESVDYAIIHNQSQILTWLLSQNLRPTRAGITELIVNGDLKNLKMLIKKKLVKPSRRIADTATRDGHLNIVQWLAYKSPPILPTQLAINAACLCQHFQVVEFLLLYSVFPNTSGCNYLAGHGELTLLKKIWIQSGCMFKPSAVGASAALNQAQYHVVEWLTRLSIYPHTKTSIKRGITKCDSKTFVLLLKKIPALMPVKITLAIVKDIACYGNSEFLDWLIETAPSLYPKLFQKPVYITTELANSALSGKNLPMLNYLKSKGVVPDPSRIKNNYFYRELTAVQWLYENSVPFLIENTISIAISHGKIKILDYLATRGFYPTKKQLSRTLRLEVLKWASGVSIYPEFPNGVVKPLHIETIKWLYENGLINPLAMLNYFEDEIVNIYDRFMRVPEIAKWLITRATLQVDHINHYITHYHSASCRRKILAAIN